MGVMWRSSEPISLGWRVDQRLDATSKNIRRTNCLTRLVPTAFMASMVRRSTPRSKTDDRAFPVRVKVRNPVGGPNWLPMAQAEVWLREHLGAGEYAHHGQPSFDCHAMAFYFRTVDAARSFLEAFPEFELADGTSSLQHIRSARRWAAAGQTRERGPHST